MARASAELLSAPGLPRLRWSTADSASDRKELGPEDFFNHFKNNQALTTKSGLASSLAQYASATGVDVNAFFPRCYDLAQCSEREDFVQDFRRAAALKVALLHLHLDSRQRGGCCARGYRSNFEVLRVAAMTLRRWVLDLDAGHLDEEGADVEDCAGLSEDLWDALVLYSELTEAQLCAEPEEASPARRPRRRGFRLGGGSLEPGERLAGDAPVLRSVDVAAWPEFASHTWGEAEAAEGRAAELGELLCNLEASFSQWPLEGGKFGRNVWVVKPGTNSKGSGVECMNCLTDILHTGVSMPNRIVQKYIERPLLLFSGRKFDIRQWVLVTSVVPLQAYMFSDCYLRLCNGMYDIGDLRDRERHISNWQVNRRGRHGHVAEGAVASLQDFRGELRALTGREDYWDAELRPRIESLVLHTLLAAQSQLEQRDRRFELFGFDIMVDEAMRPWLLEVNLSPGCDCRTPFLETMLTRMSRRLIEVAVLGQGEPDGELPDWLPLSGAAAAAGGQGAVAASSMMPGCGTDLTVSGQPVRPPRRQPLVSRRPAVPPGASGGSASCGPPRPPKEPSSACRRPPPRTGAVRGAAARAPVSRNGSRGCDAAAAAAIDGAVVVESAPPEAGAADTTSSIVVDATFANADADAKLRGTTSATDGAVVVESAPPEAVSADTTSRIVADATVANTDADAKSQGTTTAIDGSVVVESAPPEAGAADTTSSIVGDVTVAEADADAKSQGATTATFASSGGSGEERARAAAPTEEEPEEVDEEYATDVESFVSSIDTTDSEEVVAEEGSQDVEEAAEYEESQDRLDFQHGLPQPEQQQHQQQQSHQLKPQLQPSVAEGVGFDGVHLGGRQAEADTGGAESDGSPITDEASQDREDSQHRLEQPAQQLQQQLAHQPQNQLQPSNTEGVGLATVDLGGRQAEEDALLSEGMGSHIRDDEDSQNVPQPPQQQQRHSNAEGVGLTTVDHGLRQTEEDVHLSDGLGSPMGDAVDLDCRQADEDADIAEGLGSPAAEEQGHDREDVQHAFQQPAQHPVQQQQQHQQPHHQLQLQNAEELGCNTVDLGGGQAEEDDGMAESIDNEADESSYSSSAGSARSFDSDDDADQVSLSSSASSSSSSSDGEGSTQQATATRPCGSV